MPVTNAFAREYVLTHARADAIASVAWCQGGVVVAWRPGHWSNWAFEINGFDFADGSAMAICEPVLPLLAGSAPFSHAHTLG